MARQHATGLSVNETDWLSRRANNTVPAMKSLLSRADIGIDTDSYVDDIVNSGRSPPRIAVAFSGGGYRSLMTGAGALAAFDNRSSDANQASGGSLGGLLQSATYIAGLSGGSWLVGTIYVQNFTAVETITQQNGAASSSSNMSLDTLWQFDQTILEGPSDLNAIEYYRQIIDDVNAKSSAGFNTTITDYWGRALSYQFVNASDGGPAVTFSSISNDTDFSQAQAPLPLIVAVERAPGQLLVPTNSTIIEFNPWEMGSFDPAVSAFAPLQFVGSNFTNGSIPSSGSCIAGLDNAGFVMGTSSSLFNEAFLRLQNTSGVPDFILNVLNETLGNIGSEDRDVAVWPNPFYQYGSGANPAANANANSRDLSLVDGGEDLQNIPFHPLLQPDRRVDVIFAVDASADTPSNWPNGTSLVATYQRSTSSNGGNSSSNLPFPPVPDQNTFVNLGLNERPTFFGCQNGSNTSTPNFPLVVYLPNAPYTSNSSSNVSTFDIQFSDSQRDLIIQNGYDVATLGNGTVDREWPTCVACAILARSFSRGNGTVPSRCATCFDRYCWNGTIDSTTPGAYEPSPILAGGQLPGLPTATQTTQTGTTSPTTQTGTTSQTTTTGSQTTQTTSATGTGSVTTAAAAAGGQATQTLAMNANSGAGRTTPIALAIAIAALVLLI
ncbi:Lysophospholipase 2 [Escovopsis weberi]|uniref:Lysophospholipase n=1 Tax=Escovopsis weberi TaxID=150374 RepID=A0A0M9VUY2_ESCWE|nr:Lysophospholipase 2 [Escovopsis weberi]